MDTTKSEHARTNDRESKDLNGDSNQPNYPSVQKIQVY